MEPCTAGLGFSPEELLLIRMALEAGLLGIVILGLAFGARLLKRWYDWEG